MKDESPSGLYLIEYQEARASLKKHFFSLPPIDMPLEEVGGMVLAEDVTAPFHLPQFSNSAVDGYAVRFPEGREHVKKGTRFTLLDKEIPAGTFPHFRLHKGEAVKIFTGAPVPMGTSAVAMMEWVQEKNGTISFSRMLKQGDNIRHKGEEVRKGQIVLWKGHIMTPASIGFLATFGITKVRVFQKPKVALITTGNEIVPPGVPLQPGQIYNSNAFSLRSALSLMNVDIVFQTHLRDEISDTERAFFHALEIADVILFTGGISVGEYDFVRDTLEKYVTRIFYKVLQKPGKPLYAGRVKERFVFALPGNPASVLVCFYEYVYPTLRALAGYSFPFLPERRVKLLSAIRKKADRLWFLKGKLLKDGVKPLEFQQSHMLSSFARANCLIVAPRKRKQLSEGTKVTVHLLPVPC